MNLFKKSLVATVLATMAVGIANGKDTDTAKIYSIKAKDISGQEVELSKYKGKVLVIVNVASKCGYTRQYKGLQALHQKFAKDGLVVMGFPCNQFGGQEPGSEKEILQFCKNRYSVEFPMFSKINVNGSGQSDLYKYLTSRKEVPTSQGSIKWNFEKFVVARDGTVVGHYRSRTGPTSKDFVQLLRKELAKKAK